MPGRTEWQDRSGSASVGSSGISRWLLWLAVVAIALTFGASKYRTAQASNPANPYRPENIVAYTAYIQEDVFDKAGRLTGSIFETYAVRRDGSTASSTEDHGETSRMLSFASGAIIKTVEGKHLRSSKRGSHGPLIRNPELACSIPGDVVQGHEHIGRYRAVRVKRDIVTSWFAVDNGCALLQERWAFGAKEKTEKNLLSLKMGEPARDLFTVDPLAEEVAPSVLYSNPRCPNCVDSTRPPWSRLDADYYEHRLMTLPE
jgi:hypothetical protein